MRIVLFVCYTFFLFPLFKPIKFSCPSKKSILSISCLNNAFLLYNSGVGKYLKAIKAFPATFASGSFPFSDSQKFCLVGNEYGILQTFDQKLVVKNPTKWNKIFFASPNINEASNFLLAAIMIEPGKYYFKTMADLYLAANDNATNVFLIKKNNTNDYLCRWIIMNLDGKPRTNGVFM